ncbi:MAG: YbjN domain-containing protein [Cyanobacteria bacterium SZAS-4]|nr:YbjN domain-containing protein [Cyanobacteria bacterium SZAS-4]
MGLFGTKKASKVSIDQVVGMVHEYYRRRGLDLEGHTVEATDGYGWWITEGSAKVYIFVQEVQGGPVLRVNSPILHFPEQNREAFFLRLLEINRDLSYCCVAAFDGVIIVSGQRPILGLDQEELNDLIWNVSYVADKLDDDLAEEFHARVYAE